MSPPPSPSNEQPLPSSRAQLSALLKHKLRAIPPYHLPTLTLDDIILPNPIATHIPNIPPDIQLPFFLRHRALMARDDDRAIKSEELQSMDVTRAIWYYRLDSARQFQRYHDGVRWNLAMFTALLAREFVEAGSPVDDIGMNTATTSSERRFDHWVPADHYYPASARSQRSFDNHVPTYQSCPSSSRSSRGLDNHFPVDHYYPSSSRISQTSCNFDNHNPPPPSYRPLPPSAKTFTALYLSAVLEHHSTPTTFHAHEAFLKAWKTSPWDLFRVHGAAQKKLLKSEMKRLRGEWERLLDRERERLGRAEYERVVGRWVGGVVPGRRDQGVRGMGDQGVGISFAGLNPLDTDSHSSTTYDNASSSDTLLQALLIPFPAQDPAPPTQIEDTSTVTDLRDAIAAVRSVRAREILAMLVARFPVEGEKEGEN
ncbi:hypothetical protein IAQ61_003147 [Plenodomus lingam]|uniref:Predicted protein n=1 Tax=Leptosphaeria maculans (strain JN3 / isolate v23.1.3 / race Av1-4-5-6-7-8) TaxID=985895 RepID=E5ADN1_LEPMJ|nr:predicted protein [Plenodomus lingam JN3]KAH9875683.1 hypothetical protein IAQ61_003147 [Plenodomus lingam]CBY01320.1 predicted protein [Plenodomus lingam JN3]